MPASKVQGIPSDHYPVRTIQAVWAAVTREPSLTLRGYAERTGYSLITVYNCLLWLVNAGYIERKPAYGKAIPWTVIIPCV